VRSTTIVHASGTAQISRHDTRAVVLTSGRTFCRRGRAC